MGSLVVHKVKKDKQGKLKLEARMCPHANRNAEKDEVREDSATAQFDMLRIERSIRTLVLFQLWLADIIRAYLRSGPMPREMYVKPPGELHSTLRGNIWHLTKLPYGITEAGSQ